MQGLQLGRNQRRLLTLLHETRSVLPQRLGTLCCKRAISASRLPIHHGKGTTYRLYGGKYQGIFHDPMRSRTYKTTSWLRKAHGKGSESSCAIITNSKKGKVIYRIERASRPESLELNEGLAKAGKVKLADSPVSQKLVEGNQALSHLGEATGKSAIPQVNKTPKMNLADEPQKRFVDKLSLPQFTDTSVPNKVCMENAKVMKKSRSVEVRKFCRKSNNLLNSVCVKVPRKRARIDLSENKSLPELLNSSLYNFSSAGTIKNPKNSGTFIELKPKKIRFSSKEMVYTDKAEIGRGKLRKSMADKPVRVQGNKYSNANNSTDAQLKAVDLNVGEAAGKDLDVPEKVRVEGANIMKGTTKSPNFDSAVGGCLGSVTPKNSQKAETANSAESLLEKVRTKPEIFSLRKNDNLTIHKHTVKRLKKVSSVAYETQIIETNGKTITKLRTKKGKRPANGQNAAKNEMKTISKRNEEKGNSNEKIVGINSIKDASIQSQMTNTTNLKIRNPRENGSNNKMTDSNNKQLGKLKSNFDEIVNSMRLEADDFLKERKDIPQLVNQKNEKLASINEIRTNQDQNVKGGLLSKLRTNVQHQLITGKTAEDQFRACEKVNLSSVGVGQVGGTNLSVENKKEYKKEPPVQSQNHFTGKSDVGDRSENFLKYPKSDGSQVLKAVETEESKIGRSLENKVGGNQKSLAIGNITSKQQTGDNQVGQPNKTNNQLCSPVQKPSFSARVNYNPMTYELYVKFKSTPVENVVPDRRKVSKKVFNCKTESKTDLHLNVFPNQKLESTRQSSIDQCQARKKHCIQENGGVIKHGSQDGGDWPKTNCLISALWGQRESGSHSDGLSQLAHEVKMKSVGGDGGNPSGNIKSSCEFSRSTACEGGDLSSVQKCKPVISAAGAGAGCATYSSPSKPVFPPVIAAAGTGTYSGPSKPVFPPVMPIAGAGTNSGPGKPVLSVAETGTCSGHSKPVFPPVISAAGAGAGRTTYSGPSKPVFPPVMPSAETGTYSAHSKPFFPPVISTADTGTYSGHSTPVFPPVISAAETGTCSGHSKPVFQHVISAAETGKCSGYSKPVFPPVISAAGTGAGRTTYSGPGKPVFPPVMSVAETGTYSAPGRPVFPPAISAAGTGTYSGHSKPVFPQNGCSLNVGCGGSKTDPPLACPPSEEPIGPSVNHGSPPCCAPPPAESPRAPPMKSKTYPVLDVSNRPSIPVCIDCTPKEKPGFPPQPPPQQTSTQNTIYKYSSIGWLDVTKTLTNWTLSVKSLLLEIITNFLALLKSRTHFSGPKSDCSACNIIQSPPITGASKSSSLRLSTEKGKPELKPRFKKKIRFIKAVKSSVHDDRSRQAVFLEEQRRKAIGPKANPALAYSEVLNIVFNQKHEFAPIVKHEFAPIVKHEFAPIVKQKRSVMN